MSRKEVGIWSLVVALVVLGGVCPRPVHAGMFDLSVKEERKIGEEIMRDLHKQYAIYQDWEITAIGEQLKKACSRPELVSDFWVFPDPEYNAFALPGGHIMIHEGLLEALESEDEISFILGHEMTHVVQRHIASEVKRSRENSALTSILLMAVGAGNTLWRVGDFFNFVTMNQYSQKKERAADDGGYELAAKIGFDSEAALSALEKLRKKYGDDSKFMNKLFGTHPLLKDREKRLQNRREMVKCTEPRPEIKPPSIGTGLPTIEVQLALPPTLPSAPPAAKDQDTKVTDQAKKEWSDPAGRSLRIALTSQLIKSDKLVILHKWQLVRPKDRPKPDFTIQVTQQSLTYVDNREKKDVANVSVDAVIINNETKQSIWHKEFENYNRNVGKKHKSGTLVALAKDIAADVFEVFLNDNPLAQSNRQKKTNG